MNEELLLGGEVMASGGLGDGRGGAFAV